MILPERLNGAVNGAVSFTVAVLLSVGLLPRLSVMVSVLPAKWEPEVVRETLNVRAPPWLSLTVN